MPVRTTVHAAGSQNDSLSQEWPEETLSARKKFPPDPLLRRTGDVIATVLAAPLHGKNRLARDSRAG
jgi:hypothetical protein